MAADYDRLFQSPEGMDSPDEVASEGAFDVSAPLVVPPKPKDPDLAGLPPAGSTPAGLAPAAPAAPAGPAPAANANGRPPPPMPIGTSDDLTSAAPESPAAAKTNGQTRPPLPVDLPPHLPPAPTPPEPPAVDSPDPSTPAAQTGAGGPARPPMPVDLPQRMPPRLPTGPTPPESPAPASDRTEQPPPAKPDRPPLPTPVTVDRPPLPAADRPPMPLDSPQRPALTRPEPLPPMPADRPQQRPSGPSEHPNPAERQPQHSGRHSRRAVQQGNHRAPTAPGRAQDHQIRRPIPPRDRTAPPAPAPKAAPAEPTPAGQAPQIRPPATPSAAPPAAPPAAGIPSVAPQSFNESAHPPAPTPVELPSEPAAAEFRPTAKKPAKPLPQRGWRRTVHTVTRINPGLSRDEKYELQLRARIRRRISGSYEIGVVGLKGGAGKTTVTAALGSVFAAQRGDRILAVDADQASGNLADRVGRESAATISDLLANQALSHYNDIRRHTSRNAVNLEVLSAAQYSAGRRTISPEQWRQTVAVMPRYYNLVLADCGVDLFDPATRGVLGTASGLVVVSTASIDSVRQAAVALDWLRQGNYLDLLQRACVVINHVAPAGSDSAVNDFVRRFEQYVQPGRVVVLPWDKHVAAGTEIQLDLLGDRYKRKITELAAALSDDFDGSERR